MIDAHKIDVLKRRRQSSSSDGNLRCVKDVGLVGQLWELENFLVRPRRYCTC